MDGPENTNPDASGDQYRTSFEWSDQDQPSTALVDVLATIRGVDPMELEPLHSFLDPGALNGLLDGTLTDGASVSIVFTYDGYEVRIDGNGEIVASPGQS